MVLPKDKDRAEELVYNVLRVERKPIPHLGNVMPHAHPHYRPDIKTIVLPAWALNKPTHNIVLHELGHALDFLYYGEGYLISDVPVMARMLRKVPPLDYHCLEQDSISDNNVEQFAASFEAFFNEKEPTTQTHELYHTVHDIDEGFVKLMRKYFVDPFMDTEDEVSYNEATVNV